MLAGRRGARSQIVIIAANQIYNFNVLSIFRLILFWIFVIALQQAERQSKENGQNRPTHYKWHILFDGYQYIGRFIHNDDHRSNGIATEKANVTQ